MKLKTIRDLEVKGKKVLLRCEFNVPMEGGVITDAARIEKSLPTIKYLLDKGARVIVCTHLGRPKGKVVDEFKLDPIAEKLGELLGMEVKKANSIIGDDAKEMAASLNDGEIMLLENLRFDEREEAGDDNFAKELASMADIYVSDAFGVLHRPHASVTGVTKYLPAYAGFLVEKEIKALSGVLTNPKRPLVVIVGGAKMETKVAVIKKFLDLADKVIVGGGVANTFLVAKGFNLGVSLYDEASLPIAKEILEKDTTGKIYIPNDLCVATEVSETASTKVVKPNEVKADEKVLDIGEESIAEISKITASAGTIVWNGPVGLSEYTPFSGGTKAIASMLVGSSADTIIGGGDTADAVSKHFPEESFTHVSTGGGASLEYLESGMLPGVEVLMEK